MIYQEENRLLANNTGNNNNNTNSNNINANNNRQATQVLTQQTNSHLGQHYRQLQPSTIRPLLGHSDDSSVQTMSSLKDTLISLEYRIKMLQSQVQLKMQREQCFTLLDRKANMGYVKKTVDEIYAKMDVERERQEKRVKRLEEEQGRRLEELKKKLKETNTIASNSAKQQQQNISTKTHLSPSSKHMLIRPQQLFLQSNQTMFSMLVDQINSMKHNQQLIQRLIQSKHRKTVGLNNQVCRKLQTLQREMEEMVKYVDWMGSDVANIMGRVNHHDGLGKTKQGSTNNKNKQLYHISNNKKTQQVENNLITYHSNTNPFYGNKKTGQALNKKLVSRSENQQQQQPQQYHSIGMVSAVQQPQIQSFQSIRLQLFSKSLQSIQKQLSLKLNIKDLLPFIKQNIPNLGQPLQEIKQYIQDNLQSMRKILQSQAQINQQLTKASRVAWFHCYEKFAVVDSSDRGSQGEKSGQQEVQYSLGYILFGQQLVNVMPECIQLDRQSQYTLRILAKGWYMIRVFIKQPRQQSTSSVQIQSQESHNDIQLTHSLWIEVNGVARYPLMMGNYRLLNLAVDSFVRVITQEEDVFVEIRRL